MIDSWYFVKHSIGKSVMYYYICYRFSKIHGTFLLSIIFSVRTYLDTFLVIFYLI